MQTGKPKQSKKAVLFTTFGCILGNGTSRRAK
jgi:hypothetical protein